MDKPNKVHRNSNFINTAILHGILVLTCSVQLISVAKDLYVIFVFYAIVEHG